jgi:hypothetical protein
VDISYELVNRFPELQESPQNEVDPDPSYEHLLPHPHLEVQSPIQKARHEAPELA